MSADVSAVDLKENSVFAHLARWATVLAGISLVSIAAVEGWQVFARYVLNRSPSWTEPLAVLFMSTAMMCGAAAGVRDHRHFGFFMLADRAPPRVRRVLEFVATAVAIGVGIIFMVAGGKLVLGSWDFSMAGASLPQGVVFLPMCAGGALIALFAMERGLMLLRSPFRSE